MKYRFYFHYYRKYKCLGLHFRGQCFKVQDIRCLVPCESKWRKSMPNLVMQGFCETITVEDGIAYIG